MLCFVAVWTLGSRILASSSMQNFTSASFARWLCGDPRWSGYTFCLSPSAVAVATHGMFVGVAWVVASYMHV